MQRSCVWNHQAKIRVWVQISKRRSEDSLLHGYSSETVMVQQNHCMKQVSWSNVVCFVVSALHPFLVFLLHHLTSSAPSHLVWTHNRTWRWPVISWSTETRTTAWHFLLKYDSNTNWFLSFSFSLGSFKVTEPELAVFSCYAKLTSGIKVTWVQHDAEILIRGLEDWLWLWIHRLCFIN